MTIATGAKTIPEGGWFALGALTASGAGASATGPGFVNMEKIKEIHYAILSGMAAADTIVEALAADDTSKAALAGYRTRLEARGVLPDLRHARNYRAAFRRGIYPGAPLSLISSRLPGRLGMEPDFRGTKKGARLNRPDPGRHGRRYLRQPDRLPPPRGRAGPHVDPRLDEVPHLRDRLRQLLHALLPGPGLPLGRRQDRPFAPRTASTA